MLTLLLCVSAVPLATTQEHNQNLWESGNAFLSVCEHPEGFYESGKRFGCVVGLDNGVETAFAMLGQAQPYCLADGVTNGQMMNILTKFIKDHPGQADVTTVTLEILALADAFPCKQPSKKR
jgi:hypothetical protein